NALVALMLLTAGPGVDALPPGEPETAQRVLEGRWLDSAGTLHVGGMTFMGGAHAIAETVREAGHPCGNLTRVETMIGGMHVTCDLAGPRYFILPDRQGSPLVAPRR